MNIFIIVGVTVSIVILIYLIYSHFSAPKRIKNNNGYYYLDL
jgi:uncharacterized membrane protein